MANLQVKDIDSHLYGWLKFYAKANNRSVSQEVISILKEKANSTRTKAQDATDEFLSLRWHDDKSAAEIVKEIKNARVNSSRFKKKNALFEKLENCLSK